MANWTVLVIVEFSLRLGLNCGILWGRNNIELFRGRLSDKVHATTAKGILLVLSSLFFLKNLLETLGYGD